MRGRRWLIPSSVDHSLLSVPSPRGAFAFETCNLVFRHRADFSRCVGVSWVLTCRRASVRPPRLAEVTHGPSGPVAHEVRDGH